jgi:hypothetical protein
MVSSSAPPAARAFVVLARAEEVARPGVHGLEQALELRLGPTGFQVFDDDRIEPPLAKLGQHGPRRAAVGVVEDGDGVVGHGGPSAC